MGTLTQNHTTNNTGTNDVNNLGGVIDEVNSSHQSICSNSNSSLVSSIITGKTTDITITPPTNEVARITEKESQEIMNSLQLLKDLDLFLVTAPVNWHENQVIRRYFLNKEEGFVSCVYWNNLYFITGTDIVRCIAYKMEQIGREIVDRKKFEEGIFSDLRALKCGSHAVLENSRSQFLKFLHRNQCLRTQKKQKVFFWFSVPHNKLFSDVLERDLKKELGNQTATTKPVSEPFKTFSYDQSQPLMDQMQSHFSKVLGKDVGHLINRTADIVSPVDNPKLETANDVISEIDPFLSKLPSKHNENLQQDSFVQNYPHRQKSFNAADELQLLNESFITSITNAPGYNSKPFFGELGATPVQQHGSFLYHSNSQNADENTETHEPNSYPQPLLSAMFQQQHPLYVFSGLPSAIDPSSTFPVSQSPNVDRSNSLSQYLQLPFQPAPILSPTPTFRLNNNQLVSDPNEKPQTSLQTQPYSQPQIVYPQAQIPKSLSPMISANTGYINFPSSGLIPVSVSMQSATMKFLNELDENSLLQENTDYGVGSLDDTQSEQKELASETNITSKSTQRGKSIPPSGQLMYAVPSFGSNNGGVSFNLINGQLFTPGGIGLDGSIENPILSTGVGISPVIGFNNGMLSAIQYQSQDMPFAQPASPNKEKDADEDDDDDDLTENLSMKRSTQKPENMKGILINAKNSMVAKPKSTKSKSKAKYLNPTLQRLQLESISDDEEEAESENDGDEGVHISFEDGSRDLVKGTFSESETRVK